MSSEKVAQPVIRQKKWPYPLIWVIPVATLICAGLYLKDYLADKGPEVTVEFSDASGLRIGDTRALYRGAEIGKVTGVELTEDHKHALVRLKLHKREEIFATKGATYWIVRPEVSPSQLTGLDTLFSGPYIAALPGDDGDSVLKFEGLSHSPKPVHAGEHFTLTTSKLGHVQEGSSVYYKGIQVGVVQDVELASEADHLNIRIVVWTRYGHLVRQNSKFWVASGFAFKGGIFSGVELRLDSLQSVISGGIAFATPEKDSGGTAKSGTLFVLQDEPKKEWESWSPRVGVNPHRGDAPQAQVKPELKLPAVKQEKESKGSPGKTH